MHIPTSSSSPPRFGNGRRHDGGTLHQRPCGGALLRLRTRRRPGAHRQGNARLLGVVPADADSEVRPRTLSGVSRERARGRHPGQGRPRRLNGLARSHGATGARACAAPRGESAMTTELAPTSAAPSPEVIAHVLLGGDLSKLTPAQKLAYYKSVCDSLGLNPLTRPFDYLRLSGKEVLYAKKDCAEQLRMKRSVSLGKPRGELLEGIYTVWVEATLPDGRTDSDMGAVDLGSAKGEARANLMMKAVTK